MYGLLDQVQFSVYSDSARLYNQLYLFFKTFFINVKIIIYIWLFSGVEGGKLEVSNIPQMITLTFAGAVSGENINVYNKLFHP